MYISLKEQQQTENINMNEQDYLKHQECILDRNFTQFIQKINEQKSNLNKHDKIRVDSWIQKLLELSTNFLWKKQRNIYSAFLYQMMQREKCLKEPFNRMPPEGFLPKLNHPNTNHPNSGKNQPQQSTIKSKKHSQESLGLKINQGKSILAKGCLGIEKNSQFQVQFEDEAIDQMDPIPKRDTPFYTRTNSLHFQKFIKYSTLNSPLNSVKKNQDDQYLFLSDKAKRLNCFLDEPNTDQLKNNSKQNVEWLKFKDKLHSFFEKIEVLIPDHLHQEFDSLRISVNFLSPQSHILKEIGNEIEKSKNNSQLHRQVPSFKNDQSSNLEQIQSQNDKQLYQFDQETQKIFSKLENLDAKNQRVKRSAQEFLTYLKFFNETVTNSI